MYARKRRTLDKCERLLVLLLRFAHKSGDHIGRDGAAWRSLPEQRDRTEIFFRRIPPVHALEHRVRSALQREMELRAHGGQRSHGFGKPLVTELWFERAEPDARQTVDSGRHAQHVVQVALAAVEPPARQMDAGEHHLAVALGGESGQLPTDALERTRADRSARIGDGAVGAEIAAAVLNLERGARAAVRHRRQLLKRARGFEVMDFVDRAPAGGRRPPIGR